MAGKPAILKIDILTDATDAQKGLDKTGQKAQQAAGEFDELGQAIYNAMAHNGAQIDESAEKLEKVGGAAGDASSGITAIGNALASAGIADFTKQTQIAGDVLDGLEGVTRLYTVATQIMGQWQTITAAATKAWTAAQWLLNAALDANPIALIIIGIVALIAVIVLLWNKSDAFRTAVLAIWSAMKEAAVAVWDALKAAATAVLDFLRAYISTWVAIVTGVFDGLKVAATAVWSALKAAAQAVFSFLDSLVRNEIAGWVAVWNGLKVAATAVWDALKASAQAVFSFLRSLISNEINGWKAIFNGVKDVVSGVFATIKSTVSTALDNVRSAFDDMKTRITNAFTGVRDLVLSPINAIRDAIQGIIDKVDDLIGWLGKIKIPSGLGSLLGKINPFGAVAPSAAGRSVGLSPFGLGVSPLAASPGVTAAGITVAPIVVVSVSIGNEQLDGRIDTRIAAGNAQLARRITGRAQVLR